LVEPQNKLLGKTENIATLHSEKNKKGYLVQFPTFRN